MPTYILLCTLSPHGAGTIKDNRSASRSQR